MAHKSIRELRAELERELFSDSDRLVAARLEVRAPDGEVIFTVGGCWDGLRKQYIDKPCATRVVELMESQVPAARAIGKWITQREIDDATRHLLLLLIGNRGGGKTFECGLLMVALALAFPGTWQIGISITAKQNRELKTAIQMVAAPEWITQDVTDLRDPSTTFVTDSMVLWLTARNPKALRMALLPFILVVINEGQDQAEVVYNNAIHAVRSGGLVVVATNPPQDDAGDWVAVLYQGLEAPDNGIGESFVLNNKDNAAVSQPTLQKIDRALRLVNPDAADADSGGIIKLSGNVGYPGFTKLERRVDETGKWLAGHIGAPPPDLDIGFSDWIDVTREITAQHAGSPFDRVGGGDFQTEPGSCCSVGRLFRIPTGEVLLYIERFVTTRGTEADLTYALTSAGYFPGSVTYDGAPALSMLLVGDATGARQNAEHRKREPYSFLRLRADGWHVLPPDYYGPKRTPWNPRVEESRKQMKALAFAGLILLDPRCREASDGFPALAESFVRAKVTPEGKFVKKGHHTHGPDGVRYLAWRFLPRPDIAPAPPTDVDMEERIRSIKVWTNG
jgi:hypothetical protein